MAESIPTMPHIWRDDAGEAWIDETPYKVAHLVSEHLTHGWSAEALHENHPDLSLAQVYAALAWFYDHPAELELQMEAARLKTAALLQKAGNSLLQERLFVMRARYRW